MSHGQATMPSPDKGPMGHMTVGLHHGEPTPKDLGFALDRPPVYGLITVRTVLSRDDPCDAQTTSEQSVRKKSFP